MSGYNDPRRTSDRDRRRERSPSRDTSRDSRSRDDSHGRGRPQGNYDEYSNVQYGRSGHGSYDDSRSRGRGGYGSDRGYGRGDSRSSSRGDFSNDRRGSRGDSTHHSSASAEKLPDLPLSVPIPENGRELRLKTRDGCGTVGRALTIAVNHFVIQSLPIVKVYQFDIRMVVPSSSQRRGSEKVSAMQQAKAVLKAQQLWGDNFVFDNVSLGWSTDLLMPIGDSRTVFLDLNGHTAEKPNQVEVSMRNTGALNIKKFVDYITTSKSFGIQSSDPEIEDTFKALNAIYRQDPASRFITRPKSTAFFVRAPSLSLVLQSTGGVLEALRGAFQTVSYAFGHLSLNVDVVCSAFYVPNLQMVEVAKAMAGVSPQQGLHEIGSTSMFRTGCERLVGMFFVVRHLNAVRNTKKMRVQRLSPNGARETSFEELDRSSGQSATTTVESYFKRKYDIKLLYPNVPLLVCKDGMFPLELCYTPEGERYKEPLQGQETADFIKWATSPAFVRAQQIMDNVKRFAWHTLSIPASMGLSVSTSMLYVPGRALPAPDLVYGSGTSRGEASGGQWNLRGKQFLKAARFRSWGLMYLAGGSRQADDSTLQGFCKSLLNSLGTVGIGTPKGPPAFLRGNPQGDLKEEVTELVRKTGGHFNTKPEMLFFLLHDKANPQIYKVLKSVCEVEFGIPSQVMIVEKALKDKGQMQYLGNIALKVNCKLGGMNSKVEEPLFRQARYMMLGGDSSHPSPGELRKSPPPPSFCALVASYDSSCTMYSAVATSQVSTVELIGSFRPMLKELLRRYEKRNNDLPGAVIYWRDGISESQVPEFMEGEVKDLKATFNDLGQKVKITIINCVKRHHTRLFPQSERGDKLGNVLPGTLVVNGKKDFFLVSQSALQGTVRPCHYTVLLDENDLSSDDIHRLTLNGTFSYGRATRSVSIHPAVYYADQVAERAKLHVRATEDGAELKDVHDDLKYTMYWQ
ncbi:hypothetical protein MMC32_006765 [Xylographa parallela]|nr:hypothetical protein [Xylographa parallela]